VGGERFEITNFSKVQAREAAYDKDVERKGKLIAREKRTSSDGGEDIVRVGF